MSRRKKRTRLRPNLYTDKLPSPVTITNSDGTRHTEPPELKPRTKHPWRYPLREQQEHYAS